MAFRAAYLITGSAAEAEDATQEACLKAWLALGRFRPDAPFRPWLVRDRDQRGAQPPALGRARSPG